jgi:3-oxoacyl-[acyl-carrier-protein] synthase II
MRRVVITGIGMITPLGQGVASNWQDLLAGKSGISKIKSFDVSDISCQIAGSVPNKDEPNGLDLDNLSSQKNSVKLTGSFSLASLLLLKQLKIQNGFQKRF